MRWRPLKPHHTWVPSTLWHQNTWRPPLQQSTTLRSASSAVTAPSYSCSSSSSSSWSSSIASIWVLEHTSLIGAESSPSTTSSLDISLFLWQTRKKNLCCFWQKKIFLLALKVQLSFYGVKFDSEVFLSGWSGIKLYPYNSNYPRKERKEKNNWFCRNSLWYFRDCQL